MNTCKMKKFIYRPGKLLLLFCLLFTAGCNVNEVEIGDIERMSFEGFDDNGLGIKVMLPVQNPNNFSFVITKIDIDININGQDLGTVNDISKIRIPANSEQSHPVTFNIDLSGGLLGGGLAMLKLYRAPVLNVKLKGEIKVRSFLVSKKITINEKVVIDR